MEQVQDALHRYREITKSLHTRLASERRVGTEDYINGQAYLEWYIRTAIFGQRYDLCLRGKVVDPLRDPMLGLPVSLNVPRVELSGGGHREHELVFVHQVEFVKRREQVVPSWVGLYVTADLLCGRGGFARLALQNLLELGVQLGKGEGRIADRLTFGRNDRAERVIERSPEIVNGVPDDDRDNHGERSGERHQHGESLDLEIKLLDNAVWASAKKRGDFAFAFNGVRLRALDL